MAVEKMYMMNVVGRLDDVDRCILDIVSSKSVQLVDAITQIEDSSFVLEIEDENIEKSIGFNYVRHFDRENRFDEWMRRSTVIQEELGIEPVEGNQTIEDIDQIYDEMQEALQYSKEARERNNELDVLRKNYLLLESNGVHVAEMKDMEYFDYRIGSLDHKNRIKLKKNYENILAAIVHTGSLAGREVYVAIYPKTVSIEIDRILKSISWEDIDISEFESADTDIKTQIEQRFQENQKIYQTKERRLEEMKNDPNQKIAKTLYAVRRAKEVEKAKNVVARSDHFFYLSGWIGASDRESMKKRLSKYKDLTVFFKSDEETGITPPTKLKNYRIFRPFELLVKMYGIPNYRELDPTLFFAITYAILFGAMFGDLGQGFIFLFAGVLLTKKQQAFGGLLIRLGAMSMLFGILYGSVFGLEHVIPALWIRPFEHINSVLIIAIGFGVLLLSMAYGIGMLNAWRTKDLEEGVFGKEGLVGFLLFLTFILLLVSNVTEYKILPTSVGVALILVLLALSVLKEPLTHLILGVRPLHKGPVGMYYVENGFSLIETMIAILSGTISFIRVGAFAINHVGLFLAFHTMGEMIGNQMGNIIVLILGNVIIIGLEGLIVFIQGLRLEYYELFSKYYKGDGLEFIPAETK